jgi:hypothetical protein
LKSGAADTVAAVAEMFTQAELQELQQRAQDLAQEYESDASLRAALQLLGEAAGNLIPRVEEPS